MGFRDTWTEVRGLPMLSKMSDAAGPDFVLVHGLGLSHRYMMPVAACLATAFRVHVPDLPGFGDSAHPRTILDVDGLADGLAGWMAAAGIARAALLGNSFGCQVILALAERHPSRVTCCVLQGPTAPPEERTWFWQAVRWRQNNRFNPPELGPVSYGDYRRAGYLRTLRTFQFSLRDRPEERLPRVAAPALVVRGQCDPICREDWAQRVARDLVNGSLAVIPGVAHTLVFTAPEALAAVASAFAHGIIGFRP